MRKKELIMKLKKEGYPRELLIKKPKKNLLLLLEKFKSFKRGEML